MTVDPGLLATVDEVREYAHRLGARQLVATLPTLDGEAIVDYKRDDWLKITLTPTASNTMSSSYMLPPDWSAP